MNHDNDVLHQPNSIQQKSTSFLRLLKPLRLFAAILLIFITAGIGRYWLEGNTRRATPLSQPPQSLPNVTNTAKPTIKTPMFLQPSPEIYHWKTFQNLTVGYTIQYPGGVEINKLSERDILVTRVGVPYGSQEGKVALGGMSLLYRGEQGIEQSAELSGGQSERITINGYPAVRILDQPERPYVDDIFIADSNNRRVIRATINTAGDDGFEERTYNLFHQILLTLRFTHESE